jgi:hypothetical protein
MLASTLQSSRSITSVRNSSVTVEWHSCGIVDTVRVGFVVDGLDSGKAITSRIPARWSVEAD